MLSLRGSTTFLPKGSTKVMRRLTLLVVLLLALAFTAGAAASPTFVLSGRGWGHGIGMSQWGAQGFALQGKTHQEILGHYYRGTGFGAATGKVRVLLTGPRTSFSFGSTAKISGGGKSVPAGTYTVHRSGSNIVFGGKTWSSPTTFSSTDLLRVDGQRFRPHLTIARLRRAGDTTNWVRVLETYTGPEWPVLEAAVIAFHLGEGPGGRPRYETLAEIPLGQ